MIGLNAKKWTASAAACVLAVSFVGCKQDSMKDDGAMPANKGMTKKQSMGSANGSSDQMDVGNTRVMMTNKNIVQVATGANMGNVTTLVKALQAADLVDTLQGPGPFTVFAPTNAAFDKLPPGALDDLLKPENKDKLRKVLLYHVHKGEAVMSNQIQTMDLSSVEGSPLMIKKTGSGVMVDSAKVIKADIGASNGVIHQIDTVLMPPDVQ